MGGLLRFFSMAWLLVGLLGVLAAFLTHYGVYLPIPTELAKILSFPWSGFAQAIGMKQALLLTVTGIGVVINALILFVSASILDR